MSSLPRGGSYPSTVVPTGAKHRVQSPLERWPCTISTDRPEMESRPYEFLFSFPGHVAITIPFVLCVVSISSMPSVKGGRATLITKALLSHFSRVRLCAPPSLGFSRQEHWSGLPFSSPMHKSESEVVQSGLTLQDPQAPRPMRFSRKEYWSGVPLPSPYNKGVTGVQK